MDSYFIDKMNNPINEGVKASKDLFEVCAKYGIAAFGVVCLTAFFLGAPFYFAITSIARSIGQDNITKKMSWALIISTICVFMIIAVPFCYVAWIAINRLL